MACIYCSKPVGQNDPMLCCIDCQWVNTVRDECLQEIQFYLEEEQALKRNIMECRRRRKLAENKYNEIWDKMLQQLCDRY